MIVIFMLAIANGFLFPGQWWFLVAAVVAAAGTFWDVVMPYVLRRKWAPGVAAMSEPYAVSVPYGAGSYRRWHCLDWTCMVHDTFGAPGTTDETSRREDATAHAARTGHQVLWIHGTQELIIPLRTMPGTVVRREP